MPDTPTSYRVEPDPEFADRLERVLMQRLAAPESATPAGAQRVTAAPRADTTPGNGSAHEHALVELDPITAARPPGPHRVAARIALATAAAALFAVALTAVIRTQDEREPADLPPPSLDAPPTTLNAAPATTTVTTRPAPTPSVVAPVDVENPSAAPTWSGDMWPQADLAEVGEAQALADAGDPGVTWQLDPDIAENVMSAGVREVPEIFARFLREQLGWAEFATAPGVGFAFSDFGGETIALTYVRCAPATTDPIYPDEPRVGGCVPTMDQDDYETVEITVAQPDVQGPSGIWVVTASETVAPIERVVPLTATEAAAILEGFLQARLDGEGAEQYLGGGDGRARLLYATTAGAAYERFEFERVEPPQWPHGSTHFQVRLFAENGQTEVAQSFWLERDGRGEWTLEAEREVYENGTALPPISDILGGQVTFFADPPWEGDFFGSRFETAGEPAEATLFRDEGQIRILADPLPMSDDCLGGRLPADATALAQNLVDDQNLAVTAPSATTVGGIPALQLDVTRAAGAVLCDESARVAVTSSLLGTDQRMRLYLVDIPRGSAQLLSIAIIADDDEFERVVESALPIVNSIEFHAR